MAQSKLIKEVLIKLNKAKITTGATSEHASTDGIQVTVDITTDIAVKDIKVLFDNCEVKQEPYGPKKEHGTVVWSYVYHMIIVRFKDNEIL